MEITKKNLDAFIEWLKNDGLKAKKSERLWRKTILNNLLHNDEMTIDNYNDFVKDKEGMKPKKVNDLSIDTFDYSVVLNKIVTTNTGKQKIIRYQEADSMLHLFFDNGSDVLLTKEVIHSIFGRR